MHAKTSHRRLDRLPVRRRSRQRYSAAFDDADRPVVLNLAVILLGTVLVLTAGACAQRDAMPVADEVGIDFERNTEFTGSRLRVFLKLQDGSDASVNTTDDAIASRPAATAIPGHRARDWTFVKDTDAGASVAFASVSWNPDDPADYLMAGWWMQFPGQQLFDLTFSGSEHYAIVDGPEIDPANPPQLPLEGLASYAGLASGLYSYVAGTNWGEDAGTYVIDEFQGTIIIAADFAKGTLSGCIGCEGDLVTRRAHFGVFLGDEVRDVRSLAAGYELHFGETSFNPNGTFEHTDVTVKHAERSITQSEGGWGGSFSNVPDAAGNPRLVAGFTGASFEEHDGSAGWFNGTFATLSEPFRDSGE